MERFSSFRVPMFFAILILAGVQVESDAAEINMGGDRSLECIATNNGQIAKGDTQKLVDLLHRMASTGGHGITLNKYASDTEKRAKRDIYNDSGRRICLNSEGGSYAEALRMLEYLYGLFGTAIPRDGQCLSACSVIFMSGSQNTESDAGTIANRVMHASARLGFHVPSLVVPEGNYNKETVNKAYKIAITSVGSLMKRSGDIKMPYTLISEMISTPPDRMFYIDTVHKAARWNIRVTGTLRPERYTKRAYAYAYACNNYYSMQADKIGYAGLGDGSFQ